METFLDGVVEQFGVFFSVAIKRKGGVFTFGDGFGAEFPVFVVIVEGVSGGREVVAEADVVAEFVESDGEEDLFAKLCIDFFVIDFPVDSKGPFHFESSCEDAVVDKVGHHDVACREPFHALTGPIEELAGGDALGSVEFLDLGGDLTAWGKEL